MAVVLWQPGDVGRADELLAAAGTAYQELGMEVWVGWTAKSPEVSRG